MRPLRLVFALLLLLCLVPKVVHASGLSVVFVSPDDSRYWQMVSGFMQSVANDLGINLAIHTDHQKNRYSYRDLLDAALDTSSSPDYAMFMLKENVTTDMLTTTEKAGIKTFTFNTDVPESDVQTVGAPRQHYKHWVGHLAPDNIAAGEHLAAELIAAAQLKEPVKTPEVLALSGTRDSSAAIDRNQGLSQLLNQQSAKLNQLLYAGWSESEAQEKARRLLDRYPHTNVIWCASDGMALGAIRALEGRGLAAGRDVLVGGVDWEDRALDAIREGKLTVSMGRHFMDGGVALLLLHDFNAGYDFTNEQSGAALSYDLKAVTRENLDAIEGVMQPRNWDTLDFTRYSRVYNAELRVRGLNANELMDQLIADLGTM